MTQDEIIRVVAETLGGEARGGGASAMTDVAAVIQTRAQHPGIWGGDILSVCLHHGTSTYAFSCNKPDGSTNYQAIKAATMLDPWFAIADGIARKLLAGEIVDTVGGADSYYATSIHAPYWAIPPARHTVTHWMHSFWVTRRDPLDHATPNVSAHADDLNAAQLARIRIQNAGIPS